ncbi:MAG: ribbon-helix-helix protein, CopG family [Bryobacterales bacterium]|nr:ribbon-helix-helix protein, CopG family [Bryobacterales bacterium]
MTALDIQLPDEQAARLDRFAGRMRMSRGEATAQLLEEALRHDEFPEVEFRDSPAGRQAFVVGSSLAVWEVLMIGESYGMDAVRTAEHLRWPAARVVNVLDYARAYATEVNAALAENDSVTEAQLRRRLASASWTD